MAGAAGLGLPESAGGGGAPPPTPRASGAAAGGIPGRVGDWLGESLVVSRAHVGLAAMGLLFLGSCLGRGRGGGGGGRGGVRGGGAARARAGAPRPPHLRGGEPAEVAPGARRRLRMGSPGPARGFKPAPGGFKPQILMFSSSQSGSPVKDSEARRMRHILQARGVPYREIDVCGSRGAQRHLRTVSGSLETPQLHAGGRLVGFFSRVQELEDANDLLGELVFDLDDGRST